MTAQSLEARSGLFERAKSGLWIVLSLGDQAEDEIGLVAQYRRLHRRGFSESEPAGALGGARIAGVELELRQEQLAQNRFARRRRLCKKLERLLAQTLRLEVSPVSIEDQRLIKIDQRQAYLIALFGKQHASAVEQLHRPFDVVVVARGDRQVGQRFRRFVSQPELV